MAVLFGNKKNDKWLTERGKTLQPHCPVGERNAPFLIMKITIYKKIILLFRFFKIKRRRTHYLANNPKGRERRRFLMSIVRPMDKIQLDFFSQMFGNEPPDLGRFGCDGKYRYRSPYLKKIVCYQYRVEQYGLTGESEREIFSPIPVNKMPDYVKDNICSCYWGTQIFNLIATWTIK